ncbi:hypothetical protein TrVFT333_003628 [Trichoderma virens FT-333]|nr:hypothetical protein TrVFT333_003628 [Trichoderma virens FT-333]
MFLLEYLQHRLDCRFKQSQRTAKIRTLPGCHGPFSVIDRETINKPIEDLVLKVHKDAGRADEILNTYAKVAVKAHEKTNCLTEVMIPSAEQWLKDGSINLSGPLAGIPVSLKDTVDVAGYDSSVGFNGVVDPSPACKRALEMAETALRKAGHEIIEINPPSLYEALQLASHLLCSDGLKIVRSYFRWGESNDPGVVRMLFYMRLPRPIKYLHYLWVKYTQRDPLWADLLCNWHAKDVYEYWQLIAKREAYKRRWFEWWEDAKIDFLIAPPNAVPAVPHNGMHGAASSCGYTFLFNLIDYSAGVMPVTHVDKEKDQLPSAFDIRKLNGIARGAYKLYDAEDMHGLPVGVQVVGRWLEEEKLLAAMKRVEDALGGNKFKVIDLD